ncbi:MAG: hypothetical protein HQ580_02485 [Planctomycetes bacterium]|nr:hypothetical protein [Planctomycetota bacterium]
MSDETQAKNEMNNQTVTRNAGLSDSPTVGPIGFVLTAVYLILLSILLVVAIIQFWPSYAVSRGSIDAVLRARFLCWTLSLSNEGRLLLIVVLAGALGGQVRSLRSLAWYVGNKQLKRSWLSQYILTPFVGAILAIVSYFIIRGGFCPANSTVQQTNIFGFAGLASLVGIASEPIALKLKQVANTLFTKPIHGKDSNPQE